MKTEDIKLNETEFWTLGVWMYPGFAELPEDSESRWMSANDILSIIHIREKRSNMSINTALRNLAEYGFVIFEDNLSGGRNYKITKEGIRKYNLESDKKYDEWYVQEGT